MKLLPSQLFLLTPGEFTDCFSGWLWQQENDMLTTAWQTAHLMNASGRYKGTIKMSDLIGDHRTTLLLVDDIPRDSEKFIKEKKAEYEELKKDFDKIIPNFAPSPEDIEITE